MAPVIGRWIRRVLDHAASGHARLETTLVYLRRRKKQLALERVRDLSWGSVGGFVLQPDAVEAHTGFEPVLPP